MEVNYNITDKARNTKIEYRLLPLECENRLQKEQVPQYIVIHEVTLGTHETPSNENMDFFENLILTQGHNGRTIGYHYLCGDDKIYQFIPDTEAAHHTGSAFNNCSIGIERLVCEGLSTEDALYNQAKLTATLMLKYDILPSGIITHKEARIMDNREIKECPGRLLAGMYGGMDKFKEVVKNCLVNKDLFYELLAEKYAKENDNILAKTNK